MKIKELTLEQAKLLCDKYRKIIDELYQCPKCPYGNIENHECKLQFCYLEKYGNYKVRKKDMEVINEQPCNSNTK